jgi:anti-anti-sigma regulatory factor
MSESRMSNVARRVDLSQVSFCSARGVGLLLKLLRRTQGAGVRLELIVDTRAVRRVLECLEVLSVCVRHDDEPNAEPPSPSLAIRPLEPSPELT